MKKRLGLFLGILLSFTLLFSALGSGERANAADTRTHYNDALVGTKNLNGTANNSAKLLDRLEAPEKGWKRYDDSNSQIEYIGGNWQFKDNADSYAYYKKSYSYIGYKDSVKFTIIGSKLRIIGSGSVGYRTTDARFNTVKVYIDGIDKGYLKHTVEGSSDVYQIIMFEYTFDSFGKHEVKIVREKAEFGFGLDAIDTDGDLVKPTDYSAIEYQAHVQNKAWMPWVKGGEISGTRGEALRLEAIRMKFKRANDNSDNIHIQYRVHVQDRGWMPWVKDGAIAGTVGEALRIEAIQIKIVDNAGNLRNDYNVNYSAYVQNKEWLPVVSNGQTAGTTGQGLRMEAVRINVVKNN